MGEETGGAAGSSSSTAASEPLPSPQVLNPTSELPQLRTDGHGPSIYGPESVKFSVEVHHGGFFVGKGLNVTYLDEKISWFDNLDRNTVCNDMIDYMLGQLNYDPDEDKIMCWCPPGKTLADLVEINLEIDCQRLASASVNSKVLVLFVKHMSKRKKWPGTLTPKIRDKLRKNVELSANCHPEASGMGVFGVLSHDKQYIVELNMQSCICRRWQLTGIPCSHACACCRHERIKPETMVSSCYSLQTYMSAYGVQVYPSRDKDEWPHVDAVPILPPLYEKRAGRRRKNRRQQPEESKDGTRLSRHGAIMHCGYCNAAGHNRSGCPQLKAAVQREVGSDGEEEEVETGPAENVQQTEDVQQGTSEQGTSQQTENVQTEQPRAQSSRGRKRKPTDKMREQVEQMMQKAARKKSKIVYDEKGEANFPIILTYIENKALSHQLDPTQLQDSMVHILSHEGPSNGVQVTREHQIPDECEFIVQHRAATQVTGRGADDPGVAAQVRGRGAGGQVRGRRARGARGSTGADDPSGAAHVRGRGATGADDPSGAGQVRARGATGADDPSGAAHVRGRRGRGARGARGGRGGPQAARGTGRNQSTRSTGGSTITSGSVGNNNKWLSRYRQKTKGLKWLLLGEGSSTSGHVQDQTE